MYMRNKHAFIQIKKMFGNDINLWEKMISFIEINDDMFTTLFNLYMSTVDNLVFPVFQNISEERRFKMELILSKNLRMEKGLNDDFIKYIEYFNDAFDCDIIIEKICE